MIKCIYIFSFIFLSKYKQLSFIHSGLLFLRVTWRRLNVLFNCTPFKQNKLDETGWYSNAYAPLVNYSNTRLLFFQLFSYDRKWIVFSLHQNAAPRRATPKLHAKRRRAILPFSHSSATLMLYAVPFNMRRWGDAERDRLGLLVPRELYHSRGGALR